MKKPTNSHWGPLVSINYIFMLSRIIAQVSMSNRLIDGESGRNCEVRLLYIYKHNTGNSSVCSFIHIWFHSLHLYCFVLWSGSFVSKCSQSMKVKTDEVYCYCAMKSKNIHGSHHGPNCVVCDSIDSMTDAVKELNAKLRSLNQRAERKAIRYTIV